MSDYRKIAEEALRKSKLGKQVSKSKPLNESILYPEGLTERMNPELEADLREKRHSLSGSPVLPEGHENSFEETIMGERFSEVAKRYKRAFDCDSIDNSEVMSNMMPLVIETMELESKNKKKLVDLAIKMIREEYDMGEDVVEIHAELTDRINMEGTKKNPKPMEVQMEFESHESMENANKEVYKRRFLNAMTQGAAKKCNHMFHMVDDELTDIEPRLSNKYSKMMAAADYMYYIIPNMENGVNGGVVRVMFPCKDNPKAVIHVQAMVFPVLIHELVKGVMELMSAHGLPKDKKTGEFVINKADFLAAEPWDMRMGPGLWSRFTNAIEPDDFHMKHHIYSEMAALPVDEFNVKMREVMANTNEGKKIIKDIVNEVSSDIKTEEFNEAINKSAKYNDEEASNDLGFDFDELMGGTTIDNTDSYGNNEDQEDGFDIDELF
jgi:ribosomal protein L31E